MLVRLVSRGCAILVRIYIDASYCFTNDIFVYSVCNCVNGLFVISDIEFLGLGNDLVMSFKF